LGSKKAPKPPMPLTVPLRFVALARGLIASTSRVAASMSTPASL